VELWELAAREGIRDIVARYNANGDTGRFPQVLELFSPDAVMEIEAPGGGWSSYCGLEEIATIFTSAKDRWAGEADTRGAPSYVRHCVFTHQVDLEDRTHARGRSYFQVLMAHGLDHWGRYIDHYVEIDNRWLFSSRRVHTDGRVAGSSA